MISAVFYILLINNSVWYVVGSVCVPVETKKSGQIPKKKNI